MTKKREGQNFSPTERFMSLFQRQYVQIIADYGPIGDHAFGEVAVAFQGSRRLKRNIELGLTSVPAFSTLSTGFNIEQFGLHATERQRNFAVFSNTAPRGTDSSNGDDIAWQGNARQPFVLAELDNGVQVFAVNAGYNLSFVKDRITRLREINVTNIGTQFRSRDQYAPATRAVLQGGSDAKRFLGEDLDIASTIPDRPLSRIAHIDGYGNIKSTLTLSELTRLAADQKIDLSHDKYIVVNIDGVTKRVLNSFVDGATPTSGELFVTIGSSGNPKNPYIEFISLRGRSEEGNTAAQQFAVKGQRDDQGKIQITKYLPKK